MATDDPQRILKSPPPSTEFPKYVKLWKRQGAPVRAVAEWDGEHFQPLKAQPMEFLKPKADTKAEAKKKRSNRTTNLAKHFVANYLKRPWTRADYGGMHMAHAKKLLVDLGYGFSEVVGCLDALDSGELTGGVPWKDYTEYWGFKHKGWFSMLPVLWGEPPAIERFLQGEKDDHPQIQEPPEEPVRARDLEERPAWA